jgi:hypothetical protein
LLGVSVGERDNTLLWLLVAVLGECLIGLVA